VPDAFRWTINELEGHAVLEQSGERSAVMISPGPRLIQIRFVGKTGWAKKDLSGIDKFQVVAKEMCTKFRKI
jgi:hypothetical protein